MKVPGRTEERKTVKVPQNLFRMLYTTLEAGNSGAFSRVLCQKNKSSKAFNGILAQDGLENFLIIPQTKQGNK